MKNLKIFVVVLSLLGHDCQGQSIPPTYPKNYFRNPLNIPILLAGNFGECRPNHFHSGIDIKTNGKENLPVHAAADGYVSRIKLEKGGFGHAIYITHPNGYTTLYAHLNRYFPALQQYAEDKQYELQSWAIDLSLPAGQFPVKKGQQIAWSGNTGASTAPHLHFEIRDTKTEHPLNPLLFGFDVKDDVAPVPQQLSFYAYGTSIYDQQPTLVTLRRDGDHYTSTQPVVMLPSGDVGMGVLVNDFMNGSHNTLNFYTAQWWLDDTLMGSIRLDNIGYDVTRYLHAYVDYKLKRETGKWYQLLFQLPGNQLDVIYPWLNNRKGRMNIEDGRTHKVSIGLVDASGNKTSLELMVKKDGDLQPAACTKKFEARKPNELNDPNIRFGLNDLSLYDDFCFHLDVRHDPESFSDRYGVGNSDVPVHSYFDLNIKPNKIVPFELRDKVVMMYSDGKSEDGTGATFDNGWYQSRQRKFGTFWLTADTVAPVIIALQKPNANLSKAKQLRFSVKEGMTSVKKFTALLDGNWLCFEPRGQIFFYNFDEHCKKGKHRLVVTAEDENGNSRTLVYNFTR